MQHICNVDLFRTNKKLLEIGVELYEIVGKVISYCFKL